MIHFTLCRLEAIASPMPVLPAVASTIVSPSLSRPSSIAFSIKYFPRRSLMLPPGLNCSSLAYILTFSSLKLSNKTNGVYPIKSYAIIIFGSDDNNEYH